MPDEEEVMGGGGRAGGNPLWCWDRSLAGGSGLESNLDEDADDCLPSNGAGEPALDPGALASAREGEVNLLVYSDFLAPGAGAGTGGNVYESEASGV